eukprot:COSAG02_NODE_8196_length_2665_cov_20.682775_1_plen_78_part_10
MDIRTSTELRPWCGWKVVTLLSVITPSPQLNSVRLAMRARAPIHSLNDKCREWNEEILMLTYEVCTFHKRSVPHHLIG